MFSNVLCKVKLDLTELVYKHMVSDWLLLAAEFNPCARPLDAAGLQKESMP